MKNLLNELGSYGQNGWFEPIEGLFRRATNKNGVLCEVKVYKHDVKAECCFTDLEGNVLNMPIIGSHERILNFIDYCKVENIY